MPFESWRSGDPKFRENSFLEQYMSATDRKKKKGGVSRREWEDDARSKKSSKRFREIVREELAKTLRMMFS